MTKSKRRQDFELRITLAFFSSMIALVLAIVFMPFEYNIWHNKEAYPGWNQGFWMIGIVFSVVVSVYKKNTDVWNLLCAVWFGPVLGITYLVTLPLTLKYFPVKSSRS